MQTQHRRVGRYQRCRAILSPTPPRRGRILHDGTDITGWPTHRIVCIPGGRKDFPRMMVRENPLMSAYRDATAAKAQAGLAGAFEAFPRLKERVRQLCGYHVRRGAGDAVDRAG